MAKKKGCPSGSIHAGGTCISKRIENNAIIRVKKEGQKLRRSREPLYKKDGDNFLSIIESYKTGNMAHASRQYSMMDTVVRDQFSQAFTNDHKNAKAMILFAEKFNIRWNVNKYTVPDAKVRKELSKHKKLVM